MSIWGYLPPFTIKEVFIRKPGADRPVDVTRMLNEIGENGTALNTTRMELGQLKPLFKDFDPEKVSPTNLAKVGKTLYSYGLIDNLTADLLGRAAVEFDKYGKAVKPDDEMNSLEFFARHIDEMKTKSYTGDRYAKMLLPDYIRAVHVLKCLQHFGSSGEGFDSIARKRREANGDIPKQKPLKPIM